MTTGETMKCEKCDDCEKRFDCLEAGPKLPKGPKEIAALRARLKSKEEASGAMENVLTGVANLLGTPQGDVEALGDAIRKLQGENAELRARVEELSGDAEIQVKELSFRDGHLDLIGTHPAVAHMFNDLAGLFKSARGTNYVEFVGSHMELGPMVITVQRREGKTPHELRVAAEKERDEIAGCLREKIERKAEEKAEGEALDTFTRKDDEERLRDQLYRECEEVAERMMDGKVYPFNPHRGDRKYKRACFDIRDAIAKKRKGK